MAPKAKAETAPPKKLLGRSTGNLKMGLVGLPNVGKSTTFNFLANQQVPAENRPFCTIDPHEARMNVPDSRFTKLCEIFHPKSQVPANLTIFDIAGLVPGAHQGHGLGNAFLSSISAVDGIYHVVRAFDDPDVIHSEGDVNPERDMQVIFDELRLKDLEHAKFLAKDYDSKSRRGQDKQKIADAAVMNECAEWLASGKWIADGNWQSHHIDCINQANFLTAKPVIYLVNMSESDFARLKNKYLPRIQAWTKEHCPGVIVPFSAEFESNISHMTPEEKAEYIQKLGAKQSMLDRIINAGYNALQLIHFFTCGEDEVRCWTIRQGTKAPQAAGTIHSDMEKFFICAEVYKYEQLLEHGTEAAVRNTVGILQKGKDYVVEPSDIMFIKHNAKK